MPHPHVDKVIKNMIKCKNNLGAAYLANQHTPNAETLENLNTLKAEFKSRLDAMHHLDTLMYKTEKDIDAIIEIRVVDDWEGNIRIGLGVKEAKKEELIDYLLQHWNFVYQRLNHVVAAEGGGGNPGGGAGGEDGGENGGGGGGAGGEDGGGNSGGRGGGAGGEDGGGGGGEDGGGNSGGGGGGAGGEDCGRGGNVGNDWLHRRRCSDP